MNSVTAANGNGAQAGYASRQVPNPDLKWEANKTFNVGIDFGFLNQRITFSPEFYINRSSNLLLNAKLPNSPVILVWLSTQAKLKIRVWI